MFKSSWPMKSGFLIYKCRQFVASEHALLWARLFRTTIETLFARLKEVLELRTPFPNMCVDQEMPRGLEIQHTTANSELMGKKLADGFTGVLSVPSNVSNSMYQSYHQAIPRTDRSFNGCGRAHRPCRFRILMPLYPCFQEFAPAAGVGHGGSGC